MFSITKRALLGIIIMIMNEGGNTLNLLKISDLTTTQIGEIFELADKLCQNQDNTLLQGKYFVLFFPESSIRTRITFEKGIQDLGGQCILFPSTTLDKREELEDVIKYIENWANCVIVRHGELEKLQEMSKNSKIPIINAMTKSNHPCEILSDIYAISHIRDKYKQLDYTFVGENGNIATSWMTAAKVLDFKLNHVCTLDNRIKENDQNYFFTTELEAVLNDTDIVLTDPLSSQLRNAHYYEKYQITLDRMNSTKINALLNPCPPFFRGEEVSHDVIDSEYFVGYEFKKNLIYVQQAIILYCLNIKF